MTAQDVIVALQSATLEEISQIRALLRVPAADYCRKEYQRDEIPRNMADAWDKQSQQLKTP